jgi:aspartate aminotransferase-like enzyme
LLERGFTLLVKDAWASSAVTAAKPPAGVTAEHLVIWLLEKRHIHIAGGLGELQGKIIRIGHIGQAASIGAMEMLLSALDECCSG